MERSDLPAAVRPRRGRRSGALTALVLLALPAVGTTVPGCGHEEPVRSSETLAVEEKAGDFLDYYETVLDLSRRYAARPDSFRAALDSLPGSHLDDEEWEAWTAPYRENPSRMADRLEEVIGRLSLPR